MEQTYKFEVPSGIASGTGNALRQFAMGTLPCWAVVAISLGVGANMQSSPHTSEDTQQIVGHITKLKFRLKSSIPVLSDLITLKYTVRGSFKYSDLKDNEYFDIIYEGEDVEFIHVIDGVSLNLDILVLQSTGNRSNIQNRDTLSSMNTDLESVIVTNSRHIVVDKFNVTTPALRSSMAGDMVELTINISSTVSEPQEILVASIGNLISQLGNMKGQILQGP